MDPEPLGSGPGSTLQDTEEEWFEAMTDTVPSVVIAHSLSAELVAPQLCLQPQPRALQPGLWLKALYLLLALKGLLCSSPWVQQVLQLQRSLLRWFGSATQDLHRSLRGAFPLGTTDSTEMTFSRPRLQEKLSHHSGVVCGVGSLLNMDPGSLGSRQVSTPSDTDEEWFEALTDTLPLPVVAALRPLPPHFTISCDLVEVLLVQLMLTLHPVDGSGDRPLSPQDLQELFVHMTSVTLRILNSTPGVAVDTRSPLPLCNTRQSVLQLHSSMLSKFQSATQDLLALKDPALLASITHGFIEAASSIYRSLRLAFPLGTTFPCVTSPREEDSTEMTFFSRPQLREKLCRHSGSTVHDVEWVEPLTDTPPLPAIMHSVSLKLVLSQLLLQLEPRALQTVVSLKAQFLLLDLKELLRSFPWVQVTEEKQEANTLLQSTAVNQAVQHVLARLEKTLGLRCVRREAGEFSSLLLQHHLLHLVALTMAGLLPDEESSHQQRQVVAALRPLPPHFTISCDLVEVLLVQLMLTLHPVDGSGDRPLSPQDLQELLVHLTTVTHRTLNNTPGVVVDTRSPLPLCNTRRSVLELQSSILKKFESATQELLARRDPALLASIAHGVADAALAIHRSLRQPCPLGGTFQCVTSPREEDPTERASSLTSVEDREEQEDDEGKAHNICPLLGVPLVEGPPFFTPPEGVKIKRVTWKVPLESTEPVAAKPEEKKKRRKKKWYSRFRGLFGCCRGRSE